MDSDPTLDPDLAFSSVAGKMPTKNIFSFKVFAFYIFKVHIHQSSKIKNKKIKKILEIKAFLTFLLGRRKDRIWMRIRTNNDGSGSERPKTYGSGSATL